MLKTMEQRLKMMAEQLTSTLGIDLRAVLWLVHYANRESIPHRHIVTVRPECQDFDMHPAHFFSPPNNRLALDLRNRTLAPY